MLPDLNCVAPLIINPSDFSTISEPTSFKFLHIAFILSDSLNLSYSAPLTFVTPSACVAISASIGNSSMIEGISEELILIPDSL
jgi:hypothetical protein